jgi:CheY-like chemotaxis protein
MNQLAVETPVILIAEDREEDIALIRRAFKKLNLLNPLQVVTDGEQVVAYLRGEGAFSNRAEYPLPSLLLLDLKMPRMNGLEVLKWIRQQPDFRSLRVVMLTSSDELKDINTAYELGANSFLVKPVEFDRFVSLLNALQGFWLWMSKTPEISRPPTHTKTGA